MKTWIIVLLGLATATSVSAGDWETSADLGLNFSQSSYNDDWTGEEKGTVVWTFLSDVVAARATERADWKNTLKLKYGKTKTQDIDATSGERSWGDSEKSTDRIFFESLYKFTRTGVAEPFVALTLESQFDDGASHFLKPALWTESAGLGKTLAKTERTELFSRMGAAYRQRQIHGVDAVTDGGLEWVTDLSHTFSEQLKMVSKLTLYKALSSSAEDAASPGAEDDWKAMDMAWEVSFSASVSKYIQASLFFEVLYDKEIVDAKRVRQNLGVGVTYKLF